VTINWDAVGAIGEILGALAVLVTLLYLARQLRENTASNKAATAWSMINSFNAAHGEIFSSRETAELAARMLSGEPLDRPDRARVNSMVLRHLNALVAAHQAYEDGQLSEIIWVRTARDAVFLTQGSLRPFLVVHLKLVPDNTISALFDASILQEVRASRAVDQV
jgi:hypothetical protein